MKTSSYVSALVLGLASISLVTVACGDDDTSGSSTSGGTSTSSSTGGASSSSGNTTSSSSSGGTAELNFDAQYDARCDITVRCTPGSYKDKAACVAALKAASTTGTAATKLDGFATYTQDDLDKCTAAYKKQTTCDGLNLLADCQKAGTLADGKECLSGAQCSGGACTGTTADKCGTCSKAGAKGDACDASTKPCGPGLLCDSGDTKKCIEPIAKGEACTATNGFFCELNTKCVGGKCGDAADIGDSCGANFQECKTELACDIAGDKKCFTKKLIQVGEACDVSAQDVCVESRCDTETKKCVKFAAETEACTATGFECGPGLTCTSNKCAKPAATTLPTCAK